MPAQPPATSVGLGDAARRQLMRRFKRCPPPAHRAPPWPWPPVPRRGVSCRQRRRRRCRRGWGAPSLARRRCCTTARGCCWRLWGRRRQRGLRGDATCESVAGSEKQGACDGETAFSDNLLQPSFNLRPHRPASRRHQAVVCSPCDTIILFKRCARAPRLAPPPAAQPPGPPPTARQLRHQVMFPSPNLRERREY